MYRSLQFFQRYQECGNVLNKFTYVITADVENFSLLLKDMLLRFHVFFLQIFEELVDQCQQEPVQCYVESLPGFLVCYCVLFL